MHVGMVAFAHVLGIFEFDWSWHSILRIFNAKLFEALSSIQKPTGVSDTPNVGDSIMKLSFL